MVLVRVADKASADADGSCARESVTTAVHAIKMVRMGTVRYAETHPAHDADCSTPPNRWITASLGAPRSRRDSVTLRVPRRAGAPLLAGADCAVVWDPWVAA